MSAVGRALGSVIHRSFRGQRKIGLLSAKWAASIRSSGAPSGWVAAILGYCRLTTSRYERASGWVVCVVGAVVAGGAGAVVGGGCLRSQPEASSSSSRIEHVILPR